MWSLLEKAKQKNPAVHCITNYVSINDVANVILALGGVPIMAEDIEEIGEVVMKSSSLVLNIGMLNERKLISMIEAGRIANNLNIPVVLDPVGCMVSNFRKEAVQKLLYNINFSVIKGNYSEMLKISGRITNNKGIDSFEEENFKDKINVAEEIAEKYDCISVISGKTDIISDSKNTICVNNGNKEMRKITGTGCMLSGIIGTFVGVEPYNSLKASVLACSIISVAGELSYKYTNENNLGTLSMKIKMIDLLSMLTPEILQSKARIVNAII